jgi:hypothetical protein
MMEPAKGLFSMLWPLAEQALQALNSHYGPAMQKVAQSYGVNGWNLLVAARNLEPDPVSAARLLVRSPYWTETVLQDGLTGLVQARLLEPSARRSFRLTDRGRELVQEVFLAAYQVMDTLSPLPPDRLERLSWLLWQLVVSSMDAHEPRRKWGLEHSRRDDPAFHPEVPPGVVSVVARIDQYLSDLSAFRDDCHMTSWRYLGVSGPAWEAFTLLWRGQASNLGDILAATARRRAPSGTYPAALQELSRKSWLESHSDRLALTQEGETVRRQSEDMTNRLFYLPWSCLDEQEQEELRGLLQGLVEGLKA